MAELATVTRTDVPLKVCKVSAFLGAEVTGIDLTRPLDDVTVKAVGAALATHEVLVFPGRQSALRISSGSAVILASSPCIRFPPTPPTARS